MSKVSNTSIDELKKYKELLDNEIITQEEFDKKKSELLTAELSENTGNRTSEMKQKFDFFRQKLNKSFLKKIGIVVSVVAILVVAFFGVQKTLQANQDSKRAAALEAEIASIMHDYGIYTYKVKKVGYGYDVFAVGFENLTNGQALKCLKELDSVSIDDPCGDDTIDFGMTDVHPGLDVEYSYWRVSSQTIMLNEMFGGNYKVPGIYCNQYGTKCIYECAS